MKFESSIQITNSSEETRILHLEPWGEQIEMAVRAKFVVAAEAEQSGSFEIEYGEGWVAVWVWPSAIVRVFCDGEEVGAGVARPAVPPVPEGHSVSSFLRLMLGKEEKPAPNRE